MLSKEDEVIAEPLFWVKVGESLFACFGKETPKVRTLERLSRAPGLREAPFWTVWVQSTCSP
jgi:hypothetical protein